MQKQQIKDNHSPSYSFMEVLELIDYISNWPDMTVLMDVIEMDQDGYTKPQQGSIGKKLKERYFELIYGTP